MDAELLSAARSLIWVLADRRRYAAMQRAIGVPVLLLHGDRDRLVPIAAARAAAKANPSWRFEVAHEVGHVPQLEAPEWTAEQILTWLVEHPGSAAAAAATSPPRRPKRRLAERARKRPRTVRSSGRSGLQNPGNPRVTSTMRRGCAGGERARRGSHAQQ